MLNFENYYKEAVHRYNLGSLTIFDIDDTLFHTTAKVGVLDKNGNPKAISNSEFNTYQWQPGETPDFSEFQNAEKFNRESVPIPSMVNKMKGILGNIHKNPNSKVIIITARSDFDNKEMFLDTFRKYGINIDMVYVERAGNIKNPSLNVAEKKAVIIRRYLDSKQFDIVRLYDDAKGNIETFKELNKQYPEIDFYGYLVDKDGNAIRT